MSYRPPGTLGVLRVLAKNSVLRLLRLSQVNKHKRQGRKGTVTGKSRRPTRRKRGDGLTWLMLLMLPLFVFQALLVTGQSTARLGAATEVYSRGEVRVEPRDSTADLSWESAVGLAEGSEPRYGGGSSGRYPSDNGLLARERTWTSPAGRELFVNCGALVLLALLLMLVAISFGGANASLAGGEWTQAWLMTFPVATRSLVLAKGLEYSLVQVFPWLTLAPLTYQLLRALGQPWALPLALVGTLAVVFLTGSVRLWLETKLRLSCSLRTLRSVQGACTLGSLLLLALVFMVVLARSVPQWFLAAAASLPTFVTWLPAAWPLALSQQPVWAGLCGIGSVAVVFALALTATSRLLCHGAMRTGGVDSGQRGKAGIWMRLRRLGVAGKDLALLGRDRNFLVQTMGVPVFVIGIQLFVNPSLGEVEGSGVVMLAYGIGLYSLVGGCFQVLSAEGRALWMLYSLPVPIDLALRQKTRIWAAMAVGFGWIALVAFSVRLGVDAAAVPALLGDALLVGFGLWCAAHIAAGISVIGCNPNADHVPRQPKARHIYLYFFFASTYLVGLAQGGLAPRLAAALVFGTLAYALWQRACDRLPWLLDPVEEPRRFIALFDGSAAVLVFFLLQALLGVLLLPGDAQPGMQWTTMLLAFVLAGGLTVALFLIVLSRRGVGVRETLGLRLGTLRQALGSSLLGIGSGLALGGIALVYLGYLRRFEWFDLPTIEPGEHVELLLLAVVAAPIIEEVLFRGLVFGGLVRSVRLPLAVVWSSALFAAVHPAHSWLPVFAMGVVAALVFRRTRCLPAAMLVHATYNLVVITCS